MDTREQITDRQLEVARLIAEGRSNPEIADALGVSLAGAKYPVSELLGRLGVTSREEIAEWYRRHGRSVQPRPQWRQRLRGLIPFGVLLGSGAAAAVVVIALSGGRDDSSLPVATAEASTTTVATEPGSAAPMPATSAATDVEKIPFFWEYEIEPGDTPEDIAARFGVSVVDLEAILAEGAPNQFVQILTPGSRIQIPSVEGIIHSVSDGDTVTSVAELYDADERDIVEFRANGLDGDPDNLEPGSLILVPGGTRPSPTQGTPPAATGGDQWTWPVEGELKTPFGPEHPVGIDIRAALETEVRAARAGAITFVGGDPCCDNGYHVIIEHEDGYETLYGHLAGFTRQEGTFVNVGDVIGTVGMTGETDEPHLHFEVRRAGAYQDP